MVNNVSFVSPAFENYIQDLSLDADDQPLEVDDTIQHLLDSGEPFEFTYKGYEYSIVKEQDQYVAYDSKGKVVDPDVQINSKNTIDGFIEVRGLYRSGGDALYIGNDPSLNDGKILFIEGNAHLDRLDTKNNPHLAALLSQANEFTLSSATDFDSFMLSLKFDDASEYQLDDDTSINMQELEMYLTQGLGMDLSDDEVQALFTHLDANGSGNIREREWAQMTGLSLNPNDPPPSNDHKTTEPPEAPKQSSPASSTVGTTKTETDSVRYDVGRTEKSNWHTVDLPEGSVDVQYESLDRPFKGGIPTDGADYILVIKSGGKSHDSIDDPGNFFGTQDGEQIGFTGSKDKGMMLIKVDDLDSIQMDTGNSSVQIVRIKTDEELTVLNNGSGALDNDLVRGGKGYSQSEVNKLGYSTEHRRVEAWDSPNSFFTVYADDESKYDHRVDKYGGASDVFFYGGDDSAYLMPPGAQADTRGGGSGNGAIMQLGFA
jgi:hypothetical protein